MDIILTKESQHNAAIFGGCSSCWLSLQLGLVWVVVCVCVRMFVGLAFSCCFTLVNNTLKLLVPLAQVATQAPNKVCIRNPCALSAPLKTTLYQWSMKLISQGDLSLFIVSPSYHSGVIKLSLDNIVLVVNDSPTQAMGNAIDPNAFRMLRRARKNHEASRNFQ